MKTLEEFYKEICLNNELKNQLLDLKAEEIVDFAEKHGCYTTLDEVKRFFYSTVKKTELSDQELAQVTGGDKDPSNSTWGYCPKDGKWQRISFGDITAQGPFYCSNCGTQLEEVKFNPPTQP